MKGGKGIFARDGGKYILDIRTAGVDREPHEAFGTRQQQQRTEQGLALGIVAASIQRADELDLLSDRHAVERLAEQNGAR